jgi:hypothetical protein
MKNLFNMLHTNVSAFYDLAELILVGTIVLGLAPAIVIMSLV